MMVEYKTIIKQLRELNKILDDLVNIEVKIENKNKILILLKWK